MEPAQSTVVGRLAPARGRKPKTARAGRVCAADGCTTRLSRYNRADHCYRHQRPRFRRLRGVPQRT